MSLSSKFRSNFKDKNSQINIALVGAGQMGQGVISQVSKQEGMNLSLIIDRNEERLEEAILRYMKNKNFKPKVSESIEALSEIDVDIVIEATGSPLAGATVADFVLKQGVDLILLNVETEATIGLELKRVAEENGCIVTVGDGDEPVAAMELYNFANDLSFEIISIGKGKNNVFDKFAVPEDLITQAEQKRMSSKMLTSFVDGTKTMIEMTALANAIGFSIDKKGMHGPEATYEEINKIFIPKVDGGILSNSRVVDFAFGIAPGVFSVIYSEDEYVNYEMEYLKMGKGPYWTLYRPYHLTSLEIPRTIMHLAINKETLLSANFCNVYVAAHAKRDIKKGEKLDSIGGSFFFGVAVNRRDTKEYLPVGISEGATTLTSIKKGEPILLNQVNVEENIIYKMWNEQEEKLN